MYSLKSVMHRRSDGAWCDGRTASNERRSEARSPARPAHEVARRGPPDSVLELSEAHVLRGRSMRALRVCLCREHGRRLPIGADSVGSRVAVGTFHRTPPPIVLRDRLRPGANPGSGRSPREAQPRDGGLAPPLSMPLVQPFRVGSRDLLRMRRAVRPPFPGDVRVSRMRIERALRRERLPGLPCRVPRDKFAGRIRVRVFAVRHPRRVRCVPMFLRRPVRGLTAIQNQP